MQQINAPFQQFFDLDGTALDAGYIYIGTANLNAETNPVTVYWDDAATLPASQPIRTVGGYISRAGTPSRLYTALDSVSMIVRDSSGAIVYSSMDVTSLETLRTDLAASGGAALVGFGDGVATAYLKTVSDILANTEIDVLRFINPTKHAGIRARTNTDDFNVELQQAADALLTSGGRLFIPSGTINHSVGVTVGASVTIRGAGKRAAKFIYSGSGAAFTFGGTAGALYYGCGMSDVQINLTHKDGGGVILKGTAGALLRDIYIEGSGLALRTDFGVIMDGSNASSFLNSVIDVYVNHIETGFIMKSTGAVVGTTNNLINCSVFGDVTSFPTSVGLKVESGQGNGAQWLGGNIESCGTAIVGASGAGGMSVVSLRLEANTADINLGLYSSGWRFIGLVNLESSRVTISSGSGYNANTFFGCMRDDGISSYDTVTFAKEQKYAFAAGNTPLTITAYTSQTANLQSWKNSGGTEIAKVTPDGRIIGRQALVGANRGDVSLTLDPTSDSGIQVFDSALTANRTVTLGTATAALGDSFKIKRTGAGAFNLDVGGIKTLTAAGQWCEVAYGGAGWELISAGTL